jgi:hypothetical protein
MGRGMANDVQTAVRMPRNLYEALQAAADGRSIGAEIRERLERSFGPTVTEAGDQPTNDFLLMAAEAADAIKTLRQPWHSDPNAFEVLKTTIILLLEGFRPAGEPSADLDATYEAVSVIGVATRMIGDRALDFILRTREVALSGIHVKPPLPTDQRQAFKP